MRLPHVFQRSRRHVGRRSYQEPEHQQITARVLAAQLGLMIEKADGAGLSSLASMLESARIEAERVTAGDSP